jgi:phospholipid transport system substrate-binding protein
MSILLAGWLLVFPVSAAEVSPDVLISTTSQEVLDIIKRDKEILASANKKKLLALVEEKVLPHFNFSRMTRLAVGKHWSKATPDQQKDLTREFRTLLVRTYTNALSNYQEETIKVDPAKIKEGDTDTVIRTQIIQGHGQQPVQIDYSMEKTNNQWKAYDVTIAGVSLVTNYRSSFNSQIRNGGIEGLIKALSDKNRSMEASVSE